MPVIFLTGAGNFTVPDDWNSNANTIESLSGAGSGAAMGGAGGGAAYAKAVNIALTPGALIAFSAGAAANDTWFNGSAVIGSTCGAPAGISGSTTVGGLGGAASGCYGGIGGGTANPGVPYAYSGGLGGSLSTDGGGGGGGGGPNGAGIPGSNGTVGSGGNGGAGDNGSGGAGGAGGTTSPTAGSPGAEWTSSPGGVSAGSGGGGGGGTVVGANGGAYGGGGGGSTSGLAGVGASGIIIITYTPRPLGDFSLNGQAGGGEILRQPLFSRGGIGFRLQFGVTANLLQMGWEVQSVQPPHPRPEKSGAKMVGEDGIERPFTFWKNTGWEVAPHQPQHPTPEKRAGDIMRGDDGTEATFIRFRQFGFEVQPVQPPHPRPERASSFMRGDDGNYAVFQYVSPLEPGWENQSWQPPHWPRPEYARHIAFRMQFGVFPSLPPLWEATPPDLFYRKRYAMPEFGDYGFETPQPPPIWGWEPIPPVPTARRYGSGALAQATTLIEVLPIPIEVGAWAFDATEWIRYRRPEPAFESEPAFWPLPTRVPWGYDEPTAVFPRRAARLATVEETFVPFTLPPIGGYQQPDFVGRLRRTLPADARELIVSPSRPVWGFEVAPLAPRARRVRTALDRGYELVSSFPPVWTSGWEVQPWQPPHFGHARAGGFMRGDDGAYAGLIIPHFDGWDPALFWPPHPRPERAGGWMTGDLSGAWGPFFYLVPSGAIASDFAYWLAAPFDIGQAP